MISVNLRDASTHTTHMARSWLEFWKTMSRAERSRNLFSRKFFFEFVLSCLLLILLLFSREEEKGRRKKGGWGYTFESLSIMRIFLMWNCLIVLKRKDSLRIFVVKFFEIFFLSFWILRSTLKSNCRVSMRFWDYFWIHKEQ